MGLSGPGEKTPATQKSLYFPRLYSFPTRGGKRKVRDDADSLTHNPVVGLTALCGGQKRTLDPLDLGLQEVVSHPTWVLGTEKNGSSANSECAYALSHLSQTLNFLNFITT